MNKIAVDVSGAPDSEYFLSVHSVDNAVSLFTATDGTMVFRVGKNGPFPVTFTLSKGRDYVLIYDNNDGGPGLVDLDIFESNGGGTALSRYGLKILEVHAPEVIEIGFRLVATPTLAPPR
jgi:hypothetical protein